VPDVVEGALQPLGTASVTLPFARPPVAAVYVNVIVLPVDDVFTEPVGVASVPDPSDARAVMLGDARFARLPAAVDFACACHVCAPEDDVAVAPGPPLAFEPYVIVNVLPAASVSDETVIVLPEAVRVPALEVE
jgi:hypothetical protein